jgi:hypothetical protein
MQSGISWLPIAAIPDSLKDGRVLILWDEGAKHGPAIFGRYAGGALGWLIDGSSARARPSFFAEITPARS